MEEKERSRSPSRRARRVEEVVGRWLRRSRDSSSRERSSFETKPNSSSGPSVSPIKLTVKIQRDLHLDCHGFSFSTQSPLMVKEVITGSTADGRLVPGDQVLMINNVMADNLSVEEASDIIRDSWDTVTLSVLRHAAVPKSSFLTAEKRARLRTNPVKVRFAEEVVVNGYTQGNSLLFLPNVLKVYLENGQTKAFKFEAKTTVKDIVLTLKEKLSIRAIEHFGLVLEEQYSITKLLMLHEEEYIQQVVHRKEAHGYRCLFRVCFLPVEPLDLLHEDPVAFEYLYLQGISDVLQERFAVEMKCNTALRLAALQMQERLNSSGLNQRASLKTITKKWGLENFVSPTLLRNMSDKDLRKAINYHMKKIQALGEPKQKGISATEAQLYYLAQLGELQSYGGKCFTATILFQDRQPTVSLLVGARYGVSQVVNHKLGLVTVLAEFNQISRLDLLPESERVSLVKIYLEDVKQLTLLMESLAAKDLSVVVTGYCRLLMDKAQSTHTWSSPVKTHRTQAEQEGRSPVHSKGQEDYLMENNSDNVLVDLHFSIDGTKVASTQEVNGIQKNKEIGVDERSGEEQNIISGEDVKDVKPNQDKLLEMSIGRSFDSHTNSGTFDNLDEDDLLTCSSNFPVNLEVHYPYLLDTTEVDDTRTHPVITDNNNEAFMCFAELSLMADCLPSPPEATDEEEERHDCSLSQPFDCPYALEEDLDDLDDLEDEEGNFQLPASGTLTLDIPVCLAGSPQANDMEEPFFSQVQAPVLQPSPSFVDSSSEDEFFDANDGFAPAAEASMAGVSMTRTLNLDNISLLEQEMEHEESQRAEGQGVQERLAESLYPIKKVRKRCSILKANLPLVDSASKNKDELNSFDSNSTDMLLNTEEQLGSQSTINSTVEDSQCNFIKTEASENQVLSIDGLEINVDLTEFKPLSDHLISTVHAEVGNSECSSFNCGVSDRNLDCASSSNQVQVTQVGTEKKIIKMMINDNNNSADKNEGEHSLCGIQGHEKEVTQAQVGICSVKKTSALSPYPSLDNSPNSEEVRDELYLDTDTMDHCKRRNICIPLVTKKSISLSCESLLLVGTDVPTVMTDVVEKINATTEIPPDSNLQNHPFRLAFTNSSLRAKIRRLPCCLSQSQENLSTFGTSSSDKNSPNGLFENSQDATDVTLVMEPSTGEVVSEFAEDTTELHINVSEDINKNLKEVEEGKSIVKVNQISYNYSFLPSNSNSESLLSVTSEDLILQNFTHHNLTPCTPGSVEQVEKNVCYMVEMTSGTTAPCESKQPQPWTCTKRKMACIQGSNDKCPNETQPSMETCGCQNAYSNCFGMEPERSTFDEELTVQEYSCQSQGIFKDRLMTTAPFASPSMPSFSRNSIPQSTSSELSPLLSPMNPIDFVPQDSLEEILNQLQNRHYRQPEGFALLQRDLAQLLLILRGNAHSRGKHHWETCVAHLSENKHILHGEARKLMSGCQRVIRLGQTPEELLLALGESFRTLVRLVVMCLWFSSCSHCEGGLAQVMRSLTEITKDYGDFSLAAEQACGRKSCHDLTIKVLAKQCTTLTSSVFCLTQLYCTLASV